MSDEEIVSNDLILESKAWIKMEKNIRQFGFREGASKGRDFAFQSGFNEGYRDGFQIGKALGQAEAILSCLENLNLERLNAFKINGNSIMEEIQKVRACTFCRNYKESELYLLSFNAVIAGQEKHKVKILEAVQDLKSKTKVGQG